LRRIPKSDRNHPNEYAIAIPNSEISTKRTKRPVTRIARNEYSSRHARNTATDAMRACPTIPS
jgi:hypothetical protein